MTTSTAELFLMRERAEHAVRLAQQALYDARFREHDHLRRLRADLSAPAAKPERPPSHAIGRTCSRRRRAGSRWNKRYRNVGSFGSDAR